MFPNDHDGGSFLNQTPLRCVSWSLILTKLLPNLMFFSSILFTTSVAFFLFCRMKNKIQLPHITCALHQLWPWVYLIDFPFFKFHHNAISVVIIICIFSMLLNTCFSSFPLSNLNSNRAGNSCTDLKDHTWILDGLVCKKFGLRISWQLRTSQADGSNTLGQFSHTTRRQVFTPAIADQLGENMNIVAMNKCRESCFCC